MKRKVVMYAAIVWMVVAVALVSSSLTVMWLSNSSSRTGYLVSEEEYRMIQRYDRLEEIRRTLEEEYYIDVDSDVLITGALRGMMSSLKDPYTFYYTPEEMAQSDEESEGVYHGVGMLVQISESGMLEIIRVYPGTPAEAAGILAGDYLIAVDGVAVRGMTGKDLDEAVALVKGEDGTEVTLTVLRGEKTLDMTAVRGEVNVSYVEYSLLDGNIGYVNLLQFTGDDVSGFEEALNVFRSANVEGIVMDLRDNPGGLLDHVTDIADLVLPEGLLTYVEDRDGNREEVYLDAEYWDIPMVVLVNGNSASASELFTAAFQDYERGTVVGTTTFGKGIVQTMITFAEDGAGIQLTTESYYSPLGRSIHKTGVEPDVIVGMEERYSNDIGRTPDPENDSQFATALKELEKLIRGE